MARLSPTVFRAFIVAAFGLFALSACSGTRGALAPSPIGIIGLIGTTAESGFSRGFGTGVVATFELLAFLSVTLFLMNLLPLPVFDGGQIVFSVVEIFRGRAVRPRLVWRVQMIGFSFLVVLFLVLTFNDLLRIGR